MTPCCVCADAMEQNQCDYETDVASAGEYKLSLAALDSRDLQLVIDSDLWKCERGDTAAVRYVTANSRYTNDTRVAGRILDFTAGANKATLRLATRDGIRVIREDYEHSDTVVCSINKHGNERVIGSLGNVGVWEGLGVELLADAYEIEG